MIEKVSLGSDFDGTVSDAWKEATTYTEAYLQGLSDKLNIPFNEVKERIDHGLEIILGSPGKFGWEDSGVIVAPAESDPYLLNQAATTIFLAELRKENTKIAIPTQEETERFLNELHYNAYPHAGTFFRQEAKAYINELQEITNFTIITNSKTHSVKKKLATLLGEVEADNINVVGEAKKNKLDHSLTIFSEYTQPKGFPRKVYLRRRNYYDVLKGIGAQIVVGDIYELDLALPEQMGLTTFLIESEHTPRYEVKHFKNNPKGMAVQNLGQVVEKVKQMKR